MVRVVSVSGGKDSTALYLWAIDQFGPDGFLAVFADTGNEHPVTCNYVRNLPTMAGGPLIHWVQGDFQERLREKFSTAEQRSENQRNFIARNREWMAERDYTSGNPFLDLIMWKGRVPAAKSQFCTEFLKMRPIRDWLESIRGDEELVNYVGIRAAESEKRSKMPESEYSDFFECEVRRPLLRWSEVEVWAQLAAHGVPPNPLYASGFVRVGCFPCIHARKAELARLPEWAWDRLAHWERIIGRSWFPPGMIPLEPEQRQRAAELRAQITERKRIGLPPCDEWHRELESIVVPSTEQARAWSRTKRGGREEDPAAPDAADVPSCMSTWGVCE